MKQTNFSKSFDPNDMAREADQLRTSAMLAYSNPQSVATARRLMKAARKIDAAVVAYLALR